MMTLARQTIVAMVLVLGLSGSLNLASAQEPGVPPWRAEFATSPEQGEITVGTTPLVVDLALDSRQQQLGLGYRNGLDQGTGMLFVFPEATVRTFWMKGMRFCLDIIWVEGGTITGAAENVCPDPRGTSDTDRLRVSSDVPVSFVLEVPAGWLAANGYGAGTEVTIPTGLS